MTYRLVAPALAALLVAACSSAPRPLPGGPPPEYEPARAYDGGPDDPAASPGSPAAPPPVPEPGPPPADPESPPADPGTTPAEPASPAPPPSAPR